MHLGILLIIFGCSSNTDKEEIAPQQQVNPDYEIHASSFYPLNEVYFKNTTTQSSGVEWEWDFGNGKKSSTRNFNIRYDEPGTYNVTLTATIDKSITKTVSKEVAILPFEDFEPWKPGFLDIHHINTGRGDATFFIFPDGTNMLFDAGDKEVPGSGSNHDYPRHPNNSKTAGEWIPHYIKKVFPSGMTQQIDYGVISHFHTDHMGRINDLSTWSNIGDYQLGGFTQVGELIKINKMIDRGYEDYNFPVDLIADRDDTENYVKFLEYHKQNNGMQTEGIIVGSAIQIRPLIDTSYDFRVINAYANGKLWTGANFGETESFNFYTPIVDGDGEWNGNPLSIALKVEYGNFDYFTGGDITGYDDAPKAYDIETPLGERVTEVDIMVLNHHGFKNATNQNFVNALNPQVTIQQTTNKAHIDLDILQRLKSINADSYISNVDAVDFSTLLEYYKSVEGHVVVRVYEEGTEFDIFILSDNETEVRLMKKFGRYTSK